MEKARDAMRRHVGYYASTPAYRPVLDLHGWGDLQTELYACSKKGRWDDMARLVDDEVLDTLTIVCAPDAPGGRGGRALRRAWSTASTSRGGARNGGPTSRRSCARCDVVRPGRRGFVAPGFERVAEVLARRRASVTSGGRERRADLGRRRRRVLRLRRRRVRRRHLGRLGRAGPSAVGGGHPGRHHVVDQGHDDAVRARARGPGRARPRRPGRAVLARVRLAGQGADHRAPAAQPPVGRHRAARVPTSCCRGTARAGTTPWPSPPPWRRARRPGSRGPGTATTASRSAGWSASWSAASAGRASGRSSTTEVARAAGRATLLHRDAGLRAGVGGHRHGVPREARARRAPLRPSIRSPSRGARCWPARTAASSPTRRAGPASPTS